MTGHFDRIFRVDYESETQNVPSRRVFLEKHSQNVKKRVFGTF